MFSLFRSEKKILELKYAKLLEESHRLSHVNRKQSDLKMAEANEVLKAIDAIQDDKSV